MYGSKSTPAVAAAATAFIHPFIHCWCAYCHPPSTSRPATPHIRRSSQQPFISLHHSLHHRRNNHHHTAYTTHPSSHRRAVPHHSTPCHNHTSQRTNFQPLNTHALQHTRHALTTAASTDRHHHATISSPPTPFRSLQQPSTSPAASNHSFLSAYSTLSPLAHCAPSVAPTADHTTLDQQP